MAATQEEFIDLEGATTLYNDLRRRAAHGDGNIANDFDKYHAYKEGEYCIYQDQLYRCIIPTEAGHSNDPGNWEARTLADGLTNMTDYRDTMEDRVRDAQNAAEAAAKAANDATEMMEDLQDTLEDVKAAAQRAEDAAAAITDDEPFLKVLGNYGLSTNENGELLYSVDE